MGAANYQYVSITPSGGSEYLLHNLGGGSNPSVINGATYNQPIDVADYLVSSATVGTLPTPGRVQNRQDATLALTLVNNGAVRAFLRACAGKVCAVKFRETTGAISTDNEEYQFNGLSDNAGGPGGTVGGGQPMIDVTFAVSDGVAPVVDVTP